MSNPNFKSLLSANTLSAILVPIVQNELADFEKLCFLWNIYKKIEEYSPVRTTKHEISLIITLDCEFTQELESKIREIYNFYTLEHLFADLKIGYCSIDPSENIYIRKGQSAPETIPRLGFKSGPNTQFFRSIQEFCSNENTIFLNETDCFPAQANWLSNLADFASASELFWILGSAYRGSSRLGSIETSHINGNALYGVGVEGFKPFFDEWQTNLAQAIKHTPHLAYDVFLSHYFSRLFNLQTYDTVSDDFIKAYTASLSKIRYTELIHNLAGAKELSGQVKIDLISYKQLHPSVQVMHGKFLYQQAVNASLTQLNTLYPLKNQDSQKWLIKCSLRLWSLGERSTISSISQHLYK